MNGFVSLARRALAQTEIMVKTVTSTRRGNLALAAAFLVGAVIVGASAVSRLEAIARVREHGLRANATITTVDERDVSYPSYSGWETTVTVSFTDTSGRLVRAGYLDYARAGGKKAGQTIQIVYDPAKPTSISSVGQDPRWSAVFIIGLGVVSLLGYSVYFANRIRRRFRRKRVGLGAGRDGLAGLGASDSFVAYIIRCSPPARPSEPAKTPSTSPAASTSVTPTPVPATLAARHRVADALRGAEAGVGPAAPRSRR